MHIVEQKAPTLSYCNASSNFSSVYTSEETMDKLDAEGSLSAKEGNSVRNSGKALHQDLGKLTVIELSESPTTSPNTAH